MSFDCLEPNTVLPRFRCTPSLAALYLAALLNIGWGAAAFAQDASDQAAAIGLAIPAEGRPLESIEIVLVQASNNLARDEAIVARLRASLASLQGRAYSRALVEGSLAESRARMGVGKIDYRVLDAQAVGSVVLRVEVSTTAEGASPAKSTTFPTLLRNDRTYLTAILDGGLGIYSDGNSWFGRVDVFTQGSPIAGHRPDRQPVWNEGFIEVGIGGAMQLGSSPWYAFGALTGIQSWSLGQDVYRNDTRSFFDSEKAYAGLLFIDPATGYSFNVSGGRQNVTLNDGFLIHFVRGSANIGERGGTYLGPRNANEFSVISDLNYGSWSFKGFYIDPDELSLVDSQSKFTGVNARYAFTSDLSTDLSFIAVPESSSTYSTPTGERLPCEGLRTVAGHLNWKRPLNIDGLWLESEIAHQTHNKFEMSAWAGYGLAGYRFNDLPWKPSISYRYAYASGDNPATKKYERFDPLLSTGLGNWLQGINFGKVTSNSNLAVQRLQVNVTPKPELNLTFDWHGLRAPEQNNLGSNRALSQLASSDIGDEFSFSTRWAISRVWYFQSVASLAVPGRALHDIGASKSWTTVQGSFYWSL